MTVRRKPVQRERLEQAQGVDLLRKIGATVYVSGTTRMKACWKCGAQTRDMSTRQTPGIADVLAFLPMPAFPLVTPRSLVLFWEAKAPGGRLRPEQAEFRDVALASGASHVLGPFDALVAFLLEGGWVRDSSVPHYRRPNG